MLIDGVVLNKDVKFQGNSVKGARHVLSFDNVYATLIIGFLIQR